jgi:hypothetical protein
MNWKHFMLLLCPLLFITGSLAAQDAEEAPPEGWETGAGIGLDFAQLLQINPRQGAGQNRVGFGSATNLFANLRRGRILWENQGSWQFGLQRLGSGVITQGAQDTKIPFQKAIDELRLNSKYGYQAKAEGKLYYATLFTLLSQLTPTYQGIDEYPGNFVSDVFETGLLRSKLFSPATVQLSAGLDYKPNDHISLYYSPLGAKFIIVADDVIAALGVHGNPVERDAAGELISFDNTDSQLGSTLRAGYTNTFLGDKISFTSNLLLFSNYLRNPQNIDVDWNNSIAYEIFKNFKANLLFNLFYDDDMLMQISDFDAPGGVSGLGQRVSITQQLLFTYSVVF